MISLLSNYLAKGGRDEKRYANLVIVILACVAIIIIAKFSLIQPQETDTYSSKQEAIISAITAVASSMDTTHSNDDIDYSIVFQYQNYYFIEISMNGTEMLTYSKNLVAFELKEKYAEYICTQISPIFTVYQEDENGEAVSSSVIYSYALQDAGLYFIGGTIVPTAQYRIIPDTKNLLDSNISDEGKVENQDNIMLLVYRLSTNPPENPQILDL